MAQQPLPPRTSDPHDANVADDSLLRPLSTPPSRDRAQARYADTDPDDDLTPEVSQTMTSHGVRGAMPIMPVAIVAIIVIVLLLIWLV